MLFDHARALFGPLPLVLCRTGTFIRVFCGSNILILSLTITGTKFLLVCIFRSIPLMDDNFLSFTINIIVNVVMLLATMSKFYIEDRPNVAEVIKEKKYIKSNSRLLATEMTQFLKLSTWDTAMIHTFLVSQNINIYRSSFKPWTLRIQS